jgi:signal transduction histidine kinase
MIQALAYLPGIFLTFLIVILLKVNGLKKIQDKLFLYLTVSAGIWQFMLFLTDIQRDESLAEFLLRITLFVSMFMPYLFYQFCRVFTSSYSKRKAILLFIPIFLAQIISFTQYALSEVELKEFGAQIKNPGIGYTYIVFITSGYIIAGLFNINRFSRTVNSQQKSQIRYITYGVSLSLLISFLGNYILASTDFSEYIILASGPSIMFFIGGIAIAIIKHRLFDIRSFIARSVGYVLSIMFIAISYGLVTFSLIDVLLPESTTQFTRQWVYTVLAVLMAVTFSQIKGYFDQLTKRLFYRDAYDSQVLLDELNKVLVGSIDLQPLLRQCAELFENTLKAEHVTFIIKETGDTSRRIIGSKKVTLDENQILELSSQNHKIEQIIVADELGEDQTDLKAMLSKNNVSILARLAPAGKNAEEQGYLVLGAKRSGNPYNKQDLLVLDIIANELVIAIQNALRFEEIEAFTVTLQAKVNEATRQLRRTNEKLKALDETKDEFISMASHQLRTPLTAVKGYVSMVVEGDAGKLNKQQKELLDQAFASSQRMVYLIADLLNVSRLKTGKFVIENKPTQLADVVEAELAQLKEVAAGKNQTLSYTKPDKFPEMMLDETKIRQVIMNFTDNALHYTPRDGHISVNLVDKGTNIEFTVVDDGLGVPKAEQHHLFGKFFRAGNARKARPDGTGLGLFMAKKVIIAQGGAVIFSSTEGKGSTFGFTIPKK